MPTKRTFAPWDVKTEVGIVKETKAKDAYFVVELETRRHAWIPRRALLDDDRFCEKLVFDLHADRYERKIRHLSSIPASHRRTYYE